MCIGGQDIPVTLRVDGGIEDGQWQSASDVRDTPTPQEDVQVTETTETDVMEPSAPLYKPVIERIDKLSERLPEKVAEETLEEVSPMMQQGFQMADNNQMDTMQMLERIMRNTRPRRPFNPRGPRGDGPFGKGGGQDRPRVHGDPFGIRRQPLGTNSQVAGLAGLFGKQETPYNFGSAQRNPSPENIARFPKQQMATPMQPEVVEEQQEMEILGQPKQFAGGGIVNALMATPIGQTAIKQYAQGGEVEAEQIFEMAQTGASIEDILAGRARFFNTPRYRHAEVISDISDTLGLSAPVRRKREEEQPQGDDAGGDPTELGLQDLAPGQNPNDPTFSQLPAPSLTLPAIAKGINLLEDATQYHTKRAEIKNPEFLIGDIPTLSKRADANVAKNLAQNKTSPTQKSITKDITQTPVKGKGKGEFNDPENKVNTSPTAGKDNDPNAVKGLVSILGMVDQGLRDPSSAGKIGFAAPSVTSLYNPAQVRSYVKAGRDILDPRTNYTNVFTNYGNQTGADFAQTVADFQTAVAAANMGGGPGPGSPGGAEVGSEGEGQDALGGIT